MVLQGYGITKQARAIIGYSHDISRSCSHLYSSLYLHKERIRVPLNAISYRTNNQFVASRNSIEGSVLLSFPVSNCRGFFFSTNCSSRLKNLRMHVGLDVASAVDVINDLGLDTLTFLAVTVLVVPAFKILRASPVRISLIFCLLV